MNTIENYNYIAQTYNRFPLEMVSGEGSIITCADGKKYIDLGSGIAVNIFGHGDRKWINAVTSQLSCLAHSSNLYYTSPQGLLAKLLCEKTGMSRVFFGNSGAEANECAIKTARKYSSDKYGQGREKIITLKGSFHGRTITTLAATGQDVMHKHFAPFTEGFVYAEPENLDEIDALADDKTAAIMIELIQGEGGVNVLSKNYVNHIQELCRAKDILLIVDEIQTGNGRTGTFFLSEQYEIIPDIMTTAKGLGGGLPIGVCMLGEKTADTLTSGTHGSTFGGNPVCAAGAVSVAERIDADLLSEVGRKGGVLKEMLGKSSGIEEVTGTGLMLGLKTVRKAADIAIECMEAGVLVLMAKDKIRLLPALNIPEKTLVEAAQILIDITERK